MDENAPIAPDTYLNQSLQVLRDSFCDGDITELVDFHPGLTLHADPALQVGGHWRSPAGRLLELEVDTFGGGSWIGLHMALGKIDLSAFGVLGITCRSAAPNMQVIQPCLRSGLENGGFEDCFFSKRILSYPEPSSHLDALHIDMQIKLPEDAPWRELILFLPCHSFRWDLHDLRLFIV
ncbi:MAG: hypothetical protein L3J36_13245 [Rhodobacteraceae bacterium]|nr:hypothetical protein [Paracoccaceae bacterium]